jgi:uncharacterized membrane protein YjjB (DUF3815 family)
MKRILAIFAVFICFLVALAVAMYCLAFVFNAPWSTLHDQALSSQTGLSILAFVVTGLDGYGFMLILGLYARKFCPDISTPEED